MPSRNDRPLAGSSALSSSSARARWSGRVDSSSVIVLAIARRCSGPGVAAHRVVQRLVGGGQHRARQAAWAARICSSTSFALTGIGVPGP
jgi:hypothetical protein